MTINTGFRTLFVSVLVRSIYSTSHLELGNAQIEIGKGTTILAKNLLFCILPIGSFKVRMMIFRLHGSDSY